MFAQTSSPSFLISSSSSSPSEYFCPNINNQQNILSFNPNTPYLSPTSSRVRFNQSTTTAACTYSSAETASSSPLYTASLSSSSLYEVLGISIEASGNEIKAAYRKLARVYHPDVVGIERKDNSSDAFIKIHYAYSILSDPHKRADYDRKLFIRRKKPIMSSGYTSRNWETDQCW